MFGEGSETCVPVSGKAKRPAVRPSVDCPTYGQESGERQGPQLHITDAPLGSFLVFHLARFLAVSAMADEVRFARSTDTAGATLHFRKCQRRTRQTKTAFIGSLATVFWEAVVASPALKRAERKALQAGHNPDQHHAASRRDSPVQFCSLPEI